MSDLAFIITTAGMVASTALTVCLAVFVVSRTLRQNKQLVEMALVEQKQLSDARERAARRIKEKEERGFKKLERKEEKDQAAHEKEDTGFDLPTHDLN